MTDDIGDLDGEDLRCAGFKRVRDDRLSEFFDERGREEYLAYLAQLPKPRKQRRPRQPDIRALVERAEKTGRTVTGITLADGTTIIFGEPKPTDASNPWLVDLDKERARR